MALLRATSSPTRTPKKGKTAHRIAGRDQPALSGVPQHKTVVPFEPAQALWAGLLVDGPHVLCRCGCGPRAMFGGQPAAQVVEIIQPPQKNRLDVAIDGDAQELRRSRPARTDFAK